MLCAFVDEQTSFSQGYVPKWTQELFVIQQAFSGDRPYYKIKDWHNEALEGTFCDAKLQKVIKEDNIFEIECILKNVSEKNIESI